MKKVKQLQAINALGELCAHVKSLVYQRDYEACRKIIYKAMEDYPHSPEPHNLLGIVLEKTGEHMLAMKHFRAAWALDPNYGPANHNLEAYGTFFSRGGCAFDEGDIPKARASRLTSDYEQAK